MPSIRRNLILAAAGITLVAALGSAALAHGPNEQGGTGTPPGGTSPTIWPAPWQMMGNGIMGSGNMHGGAFGNGTAMPQPACPGTGNSGSAPCGNQGSGNMPMPQGQMLPKTR